MFTKTNRKILKFLTLFIIFNCVFAVNEQSESENLMELQTMNYAMPSISIGSVTASFKKPNSTVAKKGPSLEIGTSIGSLSINSSKISINPSQNLNSTTNNKPSTFNTTNNGSASIGSNQKLNSTKNHVPPSNLGISFKNSTNKIESGLSNASSLSNNIKILNNSNISLPNCFYDTAGNMINRLEKTVKYYSNLCSLQNKPKINRLLAISGIVGLIDGYNKLNSTNVSSQLVTAINSLDSFSDFKFSSYLSQIKAAFKSKTDYSNILNNLWPAISDELDLLVRDNNYPIFFRANIWTVIQAIKSINFLKIHYMAKETQCISNTWEGILDLKELSGDSNFMSIIRPEGICKTDATNIHSSASTYENGGIAMTFWGSENLLELGGKRVTPLVGYINNIIVYEYNLIPQNNSVVHQIKILDVIKIIYFRNHLKSKLIPIVRITISQ